LPLGRFGILSWVEKEIKPQEEHVSNGIAWWSVGKITQIRCMGDNRKGDRFDPSWWRILFLIGT
jgi:hypothetical protein